MSNPKVEERMTAGIDEPPRTFRAMLEVSGLTKSFGGKPALRELSFSVREGEVFGLLGHNGAGKSTALGIILGMVEPDEGAARIAGVSVQKNRAPKPLTESTRARGKQGMK